LLTNSSSLRIMPTMIRQNSVVSTHLTKPTDSPDTTVENLITNKVTAVIADKTTYRGMETVPTISKLRLAILLIFTLVFIYPTINHAQGLTAQRQATLIHMLKHDCGSCHGLTMKGGLGPPLTPDALAEKDIDVLSDTVFYGLPERAMPPWEGLLSREEIVWLIRELQKGLPQ
jgi:cytochrome c55X